MAENEFRGLAKLTVKLQTGVDGQGHLVTNSHIYSRVKLDTDDPDSYVVAAALTQLSSNLIHALPRVDDAADLF